MVACARYGNSYAASSVFAAPASAPSGSPSQRAGAPGFAASLRYSAMISAEPSLNACDSSHSTASASRPFFACQKSDAITATPCGTASTSTTPFTSFARAASNDLTLVPKRGGCATTAVSIPGSFTSCVYIAVPVDFACASVRGARWPM